MREIGKPNVELRVLPGIPEDVAQNRENLRAVCGQICSLAVGHAVKVAVSWEHFNALK